MLYLLLILLLLTSMGIAAVSFAPWVPARKTDLARIFKLADLKPGQIFYDLGCGDGRNVIMAAKKYQAKAIGLEIALPLYFICKLKQLLSHNKNITFKFKNLFKEDLSNADVVYFFGMPDKINNKLRLKLEKELKPGTKVISYIFNIHEWEPIAIDKSLENKSNIYLYKM